PIRRALSNPGMKVVSACQRFCRRAGIFACFLGDVTFAAGTITLCTGITAGCPGSIPSCCQIGISVFPNLSNAACDVHTSNTCRAFPESSLRLLERRSLSVRLYGGNPAPPGRYRLVVIREGYALPNTDLLATLAPKVTGMSYDDYMNKATSLR